MRLVFLALFFLSSACFANDEVRIQKLFERVKCPVCHGQSIKESNAIAAEHLKVFITHQVSIGKTDNEILEHLKRSYGEDIVFHTSVNKYTLLLWLLPAVIFILLIYRSFKRF